MRTNTVALALPVALVLTFTAGCGTGEGTGSGKGTGTGTKAAAPATPSAASNGVEKLGAAQILARARKATAAAPSVRLKGTFKEGGDDVALDFRFAGRKRAGGTLGMGNQHLELTRIGSTVYFKGNDKFLRSIGGKDAVTLMSGKYVKTTTKAEGFAEIAVLTDIHGLLAGMLRAGRGWDKGRTGTVAGRPAVTLTGPDGEQIHVATQGQPYLLQLDGGPTNRLEFLSYGERVDLKPPPAGTVIELP